MDSAVALLGLAQKILGSSLTGFEVMNRYSVSLVSKHMPHLRIPFLSENHEQHFVLLETSDSVSVEHARTQLEMLLEQGIEWGLVEMLCWQRALSSPSSCGKFGRAFRWQATRKAGFHMIFRFLFRALRSFQHGYLRT